MNKTLIVLGSGFDLDLGLRNSFLEFNKSLYCPVFCDSLWSAFENTLRNKVINWYNEGQQEEQAHRLNLLWQQYTKKISYFFTEKSDEFNINKNACAYRFLENITSNSKIYTFNYTNPNDYIDFTLTNDITFLHGRYYRDTFKKNELVMAQKDIILGIDNCIPQDGVNNHYIKPLVKKNNSTYKETNIVSDLLKVENVIFYGFSMGIVDFGYFKRLFESICNGKTNLKKIFYVTLNEKGLKGFYDNLEVLGGKYDIINKNVLLVPIYTENGANDKQFCKMLGVL